MKKIKLIAEIGINHNGDLEIAKKLIKESADCGFEFVKFQKRDVDLVYEQSYLKELRKSPWGKTQRDQKEGLELNLKDYREIDKFCKDLKISWLASAWDINSLVFLDEFNLGYQKIASAMIVDKNFLIESAKRKKYTFISTGMSTKSDIDFAVDTFKKANCPFELMHCVSTYPMKIEDANLLTIQALKKEYNCDVGYSGHEVGVATSLAASLLGITSLERHITLDRSMYGSDQASSLEINGMRQLTKLLGEMQASLGSEKIGFVSDEEKEIAKKLRQHIKNT